MKRGKNRFSIAMLYGPVYANNNKKESRGKDLEII
jgi:hypothetical protein